jgi:hypothetical protein
MSDGFDTGDRGRHSPQPTSMPSPHRWSRRFFCKSHPDAIGRRAKLAFRADVDGRSKHIGEVETHLGSTIRRVCAQLVRQFFDVLLARSPTGPCSGVWPCVCRADSRGPPVFYEEPVRTSDHATSSRCGVSGRLFDNPNSTFKKNRRSESAIGDTRLN